LYFISKILYSFRHLFQASKTPFQSLLELSMISALICLRSVLDIVGLSIYLTLQISGSHSLNATQTFKTLTHLIPQLPKPQPAQPQPSALPSALPSDQASRAETIDIDFRHNYYKDLGVESHVSVDSINRGFKSKCAFPSWTFRLA